MVHLDSLYNVQLGTLVTLLSAGGGGGPGGKLTGPHLALTEK